MRMGISPIRIMSFYFIEEGIIDEARIQYNHPVIFSYHSHPVWHGQ